MLTEKEPAAAVSRLNDLLLQAGLADRFVTLAACQLDLSQQRVTLVNAGHMAPLLYHANGSVEETVDRDTTGVPLGVMEGFQYVAKTIDLKLGDTIVLFTDGVTDAYNTQNEAFGPKGILAALQSPGLTPAQVGERIIQAVKKHSAGRDQHDDIALVCFGRLKGA
jgi:serine phosphatase RsbU (regulator of sigma subunit)